MSTLNHGEIAVAFTLDELRVLVKSVSRTRDAELRKLSRLRAGTPVYEQVKGDFELVDECDAKLGNAISELISGME